MYRKYADPEKELSFIIYHDCLAQLLASMIVFYSLTYIFWGDNVFRIVLLYIELCIGFISLFTGMAVSLYAVRLFLIYYGRLNGQTNELIFKGLMSLIGCLLSCFFVGLLWDWIISTYYAIIAAPVDMRWFFWEFFVMYIVLLTQIDTFSDLRKIALKNDPNIEIPQIGQLALAEGGLNELQIKQIEHQQYMWKKRAFKKLMCIAGGPERWAGEVGRRGGPELYD